MGTGRAVRYVIPTSSRPIIIDEPDGDQLASAILTRRLRKCIAEGAHQLIADNGCSRCGVAHAATAQAINDRKAEQEGQ